MLETILVCNVVLCFSHNNIACIYINVECKRPNAPNVCHKLLSISLPHEQVCSQIIEYQAYQYVSNIDILQQFVSKPLTILQLPRIGGRHGVALRLCIIVQLKFKLLRIK